MRRGLGGMGDRMKVGEDGALDIISEKEDLIRGKRGRKNLTLFMYKAQMCTQYINRHIKIL